MTKLTKSQFKTFTADSTSIDKAIVTVDGVSYRKVIAKVRFDDSCGNGHNSFSITGDAWRVGSRIRKDDPDACGCIHEIIEAAFPELAHLIKWHLCSTDGPMHYIANTLYHARTCSHEGKKPGDPVKFERVITLGNSSYPIKFSTAVMDYLITAQKSGFKLGVKAVEHRDNSKPGSYQFDPKFTFDSFDCEWYQCPFDSLDDAQRFIDTFHNHGMTIVSRPVAYAESVKPDLNAARKCAIWPDATLEQLQDKEVLINRLPSLLVNMKHDIESLGFEW